MFTDLMPDGSITQANIMLARGIFRLSEKEVFVKYIDLTWPIEEHWRYPLFKRGLLSSFEDGKLWQITEFTLGSHWFSHIDFPLHTGAGLADSNCYPLEHYNGMASVVDLRTGESLRNHAFTKEEIQKATEGRKMEKIWLLRSDWDKEVSHMTKEFWLDAPYLSDDAIDYLATLGLNAIAFDFPQDYAIRPIFDHPVSPEEQRTHVELLRKGTLLIEYVWNFDQIGQDTCEIICMPLRLEHIDGCPVRLVAKV